MAYDFDLSGGECRTCGGEFEPGDRVRAVMGGDAREASGSDVGLHTDSLEFHHSACVKVEDKRPPITRWFEYVNADGERTVHLAKWGVGADGAAALTGSLCGAVRALDPDHEMHEVRTRGVADMPGMCRRCLAVRRRERREGLR